MRNGFFITYSLISDIKMYSRIRFYTCTVITLSNIRLEFPSLCLASSFVSSREESRAMNKGGKKRRGTTKRRRAMKWWVDAADGSIVFSNLDGNPSTAGNSRVPLQPPATVFEFQRVQLGRKPIERARRASTEPGFCAASQGTGMACQACQRIS